MAEEDAQQQTLSHPLCGVHAAPRAGFYRRLRPSLASLLLQKKKYKSQLFLFVHLFHSICFIFSFLYFRRQVVAARSAVWVYWGVRTPQGANHPAAVQLPPSFSAASFQK